MNTIITKTVYDTIVKPCMTLIYKNTKNEQKELLLNRVWHL